MVDLLFDDWQPRGVLEVQTVLSLAELMWRKGRLKIFRNAASAKALRERVRSADNPLGVVVSVVEEIGCIEGLHKVFHDPRVITAIQTDPKVERLFRDSPLWDSLDEKAHHMLTSTFDLLGVGESPREAYWDQVRRENELADLAEVMTLESFETQLRLDERLESMIDRCIKRLQQLKSMRRMHRLELEAEARRVSHKADRGIG